MTAIVSISWICETPRDPIVCTDHELSTQTSSSWDLWYFWLPSASTFSAFLLNPEVCGHWFREFQRDRKESCMYASIFNKSCFLTVLHTGPHSIPQRSWCEFFISHASVSCSWAVSTHRSPFLPRRTAWRIYWALEGRAAVLCRRKKKGTSLLLHYRGQI